MNSINLTNTNGKIALAHTEIVIDFTSMEDIKKFVIDLVENEIITQKEADNININKVFAFTKSLIWNQLKFQMV